MFEIIKTKKQKKKRTRKKKQSKTCATLSYMCDWTLNAKKLALRLEHIFFSISCGLVFSHSTKEPPLYVCSPRFLCYPRSLLSWSCSLFLMAHCLCSITTLFLAFAQGVFKCVSVSKPLPCVQCLWVCPTWTFDVHVHIMLWYMCTEKVPSSLLRNLWQVEGFRRPDVARNFAQNLWWPKYFVILFYSFWSSSLSLSLNQG